ncbi:hypothetical protein D6D15_09614 [Aureobasidium pullulans]|uniref:Eukaryotic translation initiation factor 5B n=1 Tax=Aureobasidium pullulans TaxID=5580 RepID=A0A4S9AUG7_AURPU|nr:hypothetical protein D6D15_09614 [Aureobasidium pullulans]
MAPKKKGNKKAQQDDWEAELGETVDPIAQAEEEAKAQDAAQDAQEEESSGAAGGLMAALKRRKDKKGKKGKQQDNDWEAELGEDPTADADGTSTPPVDLAAKAPEEGTMDDEDLYPEPAKKGKGGKGGKQQQQAQPEQNGDDDDEMDASGRVLTKKEKEKLKKEREKQRKKEQAAAKKKAGGAVPAAPKPQPIRDTPSPTVAEPVAAAPEPAAGGKKKKLNPALAALQRQQAELKAREEEAARLEAEERARAEEDEKNAAEEAKAREEAKALKKQKEKEKIEQLKKEGKYKTKAQKEAEARQQARLQQMLEGGAIVAGISGEGDDAKKAQKEKDRRKKNPRKAAEERAAAEAAKAEEEAQKKLEELRIAEEQKKAAEEAAEKAKADALEKKAEDDDELDDWEAEAEKMENEGVKDSWDAESGDEDTEIVKPVVNGKPVQKGAAGKKADIKEESDSDSDSGSDSDSDSDSDSSSDAEESANARAIAQRKKEAAERRQKTIADARAAASKDNLRSPICCILGHVDTGKTKLLDKIRQTNVQEGEAGGITQQIGATYFPVEALEKKTAVVNTDGAFKFKIPGLLVIDTPGHESFTNLRSRGSSLCNIAILVVDIMHGLEPQTLESMRLLRDRKTPFIVALNKIDRLYGWKQIANNGFRESLAMQNKGVQNEFADRLEKTKIAFAEQGFNSEVFYENKSMARNVSLVPTSAHTGEGIPDMLKLITQLTQERMAGQLMYITEVECTVLEVKVIEGLGTTIDVVITNGRLKEGDRIVLCGTEGPIATNIRALLTPAEMKELRVKSAYVHNKEVKAALGVKITANGLENAIAGSRLLLVKEDDDEEELMDDVMSDLENLLSKISTSGRGVTVQASTLGSLEALLEFLKQMKIPVGSISIGNVHRRDVITASTMLEKHKQYAVMLCFDVRVDKEAQAYADEVGVKIFTADIIYHLFDAFTKHMAEIAAQKKEESKMLAVFPCILNPIQVFNKTNPIVVGVDVLDGALRVNTPIAAVKTNPVTGAKEVIPMGRVTSIEREHKQIPLCKKGQPSVAVKIEGSNQPTYGRQLEDKMVLYSHISRASIDTLKEFYRDEVTKEEWNLIAKHLKGLFDVV